MSLPWNKSVRLHIGDQSVEGVLHPAWAPRRPVRSALHRSATSAPHGKASPALTSSVPFDGAMTATLNELGVAPNSGVKNAQILMANARVHFDVVSGEYADLSDRQLQTIAQACVGEILGDRALGTAVRWQLQKDAHHLLIAAIESREVEQIEALGREHGLERISLQPEFCWHWNNHASLLAKDLAVFATAGESHTVVALVVAGSIAAISCGSVPTQAADPNEASEQPKGALDDRVDRLLSSEGHDLSQVQGYFLVTKATEALALSARWQVLNPGSERS